MIKDVNECIDLIKRLNDLDDKKIEDIEEVLDMIRPYLSRRYGPRLMPQIEKLMRAGNIDRALKLLDALPKSRFFIPVGQKLPQMMTIIMVAVSGIAFFLITRSNSTPADESQNSGEIASWSSTDGTVIKSRVGSQYSIDDASTKEFPDIQYSYNVNGTKYISDSVSYSNTEDPSIIINEYPEGTQITVHYNPQDPETVVFEPGLSSFTFMWVIGVSVFLIAIFYMYRSRKKKISEQSFNK